MSYTLAMKDGLIAAAAIIGSVFLAVGAVYLLHQPSVSGSQTALTTSVR
jgi:hypothetical protein